MPFNPMFSIFHEFSIEIAAPLHEVWEFAQNPSNWIMWGTMYEACYLKGGQFKSGEVIKVKVKNKPRPFSLLLTEVIPQREYKTKTKVLGTSEENTYSLQMLTPYRTKFTSTLLLKSFITPFLRSILIRKIHERKSSALKAFAKIVEEKKV
jgi:hypothetical protein